MEKVRKQFAARLDAPKIKKGAAVVTFASSVDGGANKGDENGELGDRSGTSIRLDED